jgi:hypothetical protein
MSSTFPRRRPVSGLLLVLFLACGLYLLGCGRSATPPKGNSGGKENGKREDRFQTTLDLLRRANSSVQFREALQHADSQLNSPGAREELQVGPEMRSLLEEKFGLTADEMREIEATTFRPLDAHHLAFCFQLRDVARLLEQPAAPPLEQARLAFDWVCRQVQLREGASEVTPPRFALRRGHGSSVERALLCLALLQQMHIDACLVALPGPEHVVVGVVVLDKDQKGSVHLLDPRRGLPLPGPEGSGPATLEQVKKQPELLLPPKAKAEKSGPVEVLIAPSLTALAPRIRHLQRMLTHHDRVVLAFEPKKQAELEQALGQEIKVWNRRPEAQEKPAPSPVRALRYFLPPEEGGVDPSGRHQTFLNNLIPWSPILRQYGDMRILGELTASAKVPLLKMTEEFFTKFALTPREALQRGQYEQTKKRLDGIRTLLDDLAFAPLEEGELRQKVADWRERVNDVHLALIRQQPGAQARANALWAEDQFLLTLLETPDEPETARKLPKRLLTYIILTGVKEPLGQEATYLLALAWQEEAAHDEATQKRLQREDANPAAQKRAAQKARNSWTNARGWWARYANQYPLGAGAITTRMLHLGQHWQDGNFPIALQLWDHLLADLRTTTSARLLQARALEKAGDPKAAAKVLEGLILDIDALDKHPDVTKGLEVCLEQSAQLPDPQIRRHLEQIARDLGPTGSFAWARESARQRLRELAAK